MKRVRPADGRRLESLAFRLRRLQRCDVRIARDQLEALKRVVDVLLHDERAANRAANSVPPPGFGRMTPPAPPEET